MYVHGENSSQNLSQPSRKATANPMGDITFQSFDPKQSKIGVMAPGPYPLLARTCFAIEGNEEDFMLKLQLQQFDFLSPQNSICGPCSLRGSGRPNDKLLRMFGRQSRLLYSSHLVMDGMEATKTFRTFGRNFVCLKAMLRYVQCSLRIIFSALAMFSKSVEPYIATRVIEASRS